jgi:signal peptidase I
MHSVRIGGSARRPARPFVRRAATALGLTLAAAAAVLGALVAGLAGAALVARPCVVAGNSMEPALHADDVILVVRSHALPRSFARGDIVVVRLMRLNLLGKGPGVPIVKRIVAAAGDVVEAREDDGLYVNGRRLDGVPAPFSAKVVRGRFYRYRRGADVFEVMPSGELTPLAPAEWITIERAAPDPLPAGAFFALGDNAVTSLDSLRFGPVRRDEIEGRAVAIVYPFDRQSLLARAR